MNIFLVLQKAGSHMEYTFIASYIVMLIGFLIMDNKEYETKVRQFLKGHKFTDMVEILKKFFNFMNLTASVSIYSRYLTLKLVITLNLILDGGIECMSNKNDGTCYQIHGTMWRSRSEYRQFDITFFKFIIYLFLF